MVSAGMEKELTIFTLQLASMLAAGLPLNRCLRALVQQAKAGKLGAIISDVLGKVESGIHLSDALRDHPRVFSKLYIQMVRAGEASGQLDTVLSRLAEHLEKQEMRRTQIRSALAYPVMLSIFAVVALTFVVGVVIPKMSTVFEEFGQSLPWSTVLLIDIAHWIVRLRWFGVIGFAGAWAGFRAYRSTPGGGFLVDRLLLGLPVAGEIQLKSSLSRFSRTLGSLLRGGVPILDALTIAREAIGNKAVTAAFAGANDSIREGKALAETFAREKIIPPIMIHMVGVGEEAGNLEDMLAKVADIYDFEVDTKIKTLVSLLEPAIILFMGVIVAFVVMSVLLPIFNLNASL